MLCFTGTLNTPTLTPLVIAEETMPTHLFCHYVLLMCEQEMESESEQMGLTDKFSLRGSWAGNQSHGPAPGQLGVLCHWQRWHSPQRVKSVNHGNDFQKKLSFKVEKLHSVALMRKTFYCQPSMSAAMRVLCQTAFMGEVL